jgi:hypothetical protein
MQRFTPRSLILRQLGADGPCSTSNLIAYCRWQSEASLKAIHTALDRMILTGDIVLYDSETYLRDSRPNRDVWELSPRYRPADWPF